MTDGQDGAPAAAAPVVCRICREPVRPGSRRCPHCLSWQARWRNALPVTALMAAVLVVAGGAIAALVVAAQRLQAGPPAAASETDGGVGVIAFATGGALVVRNGGDEDVFIESLAIESAPYAYFGHVILGSVAPARAFHVIPQPAVPGGPLVGNVSDEVWQQVLDKTFPDVQPRFYSAGHVYLRAVRAQIGDGVRTIPAQCRLDYSTFTSTAPLSIDFDCTGVFMRIDAAGDGKAPPG